MRMRDMPTGMVIWCVVLTAGCCTALVWSAMAAVSAETAKESVNTVVVEPEARYPDDSRTLSEIKAEMFNRGTDLAIAGASELGGIVDPGNIAAALDTACPTEDSVNCYWVAENQGNGEGESFVNIEGHVFPLTSLLG